MIVFMQKLELTNENKFKEKLLLSKPIEVSYYIAQNTKEDKIILEREGYIKLFGDVCVERFINEQLQIEIYKKKDLRNDIQTNPNTIEDDDKTKCWLCGKDSKARERCSKSEKTGHPHLKRRE